MNPTIRQCRRDDEQSVVGLSLRAWAPVFDSMEETLGAEIFVRIYGVDWREYQATDVRAALVDDEIQVWVAEAPEVIGFVAAKTLDQDRGVGEVWMLAVDPDYQGQGIGTALTTYATERLREAGMRVAMISTGGDPGHAPARRAYEKAQYTLMPMARYWMAL